MMTAGSIEEPKFPVSVQYLFNDICRRAKRIHDSGSLAASNLFYQVLGIPKSPKQADEPQQQSKKRDPFQVKQVLPVEKTCPTFKTDSYQICYQSYQLSSFVDDLQLHHSIPTRAPITTEIAEVQIVTLSL